MKVSGNELLLIYDSEILEDRKALGYAQSLQHHKLKEKDIRKEPLTSTQIEEVIEALGIDAHEIIDKQSEIYKNEYSEVSLEGHDLLTALSKNPALMKTPIAIREGSAKFVGSSYEFIEEDMDSNNEAPENRI